MNDTIKKNLTALGIALQIGILVFFVSFSAASLIFNQELTEYLPKGIGIFLISIIIFNLIIPKLSKIPGIIALPQPIVCASIALIVLPIAKKLTQQQLNDQIFPTIIALIALSSVFIGITFFVLGYFRLGRLLQIIPYPIICGVLSGLGLIILINGLSILVGRRITWENLSQILQLSLFPQLFLGMAVALIYNTFYFFLSGKKLAWITRSIFAFILLSLYYVSHKFISQPISYPIFLTTKAGALWPPISFFDLGLINWQLLVLQTTDFIVMIFTAVIAFVFYANSLEIYFQKNLDIDSELCVEGFANIVTSLGGGVPGFQMPILTMQFALQNFSNSIVNIFVALIALGLLFVDASVFNFVPTAVMAGVIISIGLIFIDLFCIKLRRSFPKIDYLILILIMITVGFFGFTTGVILGITIAAIIFIFDQSKSDVIKYAISGRYYHSRVERSENLQNILEQEGEKIYIINLQGTLFFGTAYELFRKIEQYLISSTSLQFLILDFRHVSTLDSSALLSFIKLSKIAEIKKFTILFTDTSLKIRKLLEIIANQNKNRKENEANIQFFPTLDSALEWSEDQILNLNAISPSKQIFAYPLNEILPFCEKIQYRENEFVVRQEEKSDQIYFIETGKLEILLELQDNRNIKIGTICAGTIIGEISFYLNIPRSSSVITVVPSTLYVLTKQKLETLQMQHPELVSAFHESVSRTLAKRLINDNKIIKVLSV